MTSQILPLARLADVNRPAVWSTGRTPWRICSGDSERVAIIDADDHTLFLALPEIAGRIIAAVNMVECAYRGANGEIGR